MILPLNISFVRLPILLLPILLLVSCSNSTTTIEEPPDLFFSGIQSSYVGEEFNFKIESQDPQGANVEIFVEGLPDWLTFLPSDDLLSGAPGPGDDGLFMLKVTADNGEKARSRDLSIRVFKDSDEEALQVGVEEAISSYAPGLRGLSVAVIDHNGKLYHAFSGFFGTGSNTSPIKDESLFRVASVSKPITTALVLKLAEEEWFDLDDAIGEHISTNLPNADRITIRQMLSHTGGVFDHLNSNRFWSSPQFTPTKVWSTEEIVDFAVDNGPVYSPGTRYSYSNTAFYQLKTLIETYTATSLSDAYKKQIFEPMGLEETLYDDYSTSANQISGLALNSRSYEYHLTAAGPAGAIASTATDIARFGHLFYGGRFLSADVTDQLIENIGSRHSGPGYGLGTRLWNIGGIPHHGHTGALLDYRNILMYIPRADLTIAIHTHDVHSNWYTLVDAIFEIGVQNFSDGLAKTVPFTYGAIPREEQPEYNTDMH